ncbi:MAG TPA: hypothetical protein VFQ29_04290 [Methyloceanibacter sp.]|nr:hypothetical protein [Methyloceanibacter sp.]
MTDQPRNFTGLAVSCAFAAALGEAAISALREGSAFDLKANLARLMASGAIVAVGAAASG